MARESDAPAEIGKMRMTDGHDPWVDPDFEQAVRDTAYFLWESDGRPSGREKEYWFRALERCLRQRQYDEMLEQKPEPEARRQGS